MRALAHQEVGCGLQRPRHPVVCFLDLAGLGITAFLITVYPQKFVIALLPIAVAALYVVSIIHHWLPHSVMRQKADHLLIAVLMAVTYVPFWGSLLSVQEYAGRFILFGAIFFCVCLTKAFFISWRKTGGALFLALGLFGTGISFNGLQTWLPAAGFVYWWAGLTLYMTQFVIYSLKRPDPLPGCFGFREVQHVILVMATTLHSFTVLAYL